MKSSINDIANPRQVILVTSRAEVKSIFSPDKKTKDDIFPLTRHMPISLDPPLYAICVGKKTYSTSLIQNSRTFVVNFIDIKQKDAVLFCGRNSGENIDKFKETKLEKEESDQVDCPRIKQALGFLECHVINEIEAGDHILFIGKVLNRKLNKKGKRIYQIQGDEFKTIE